MQVYVVTAPTVELAVEVVHVVEATVPVPDSCQVIPPLASLGAVAPAVPVTVTV